MRCLPSWPRGLSKAIAAAIACLGASSARAQSATPLDRFQPAPAGDALFASPSVTAGAHLATDAALVLSFAGAPLALRVRDGEGEYTDAGAIVGHQAALHVLGSVTLFSRLKVDVDVPMTLDQAGDSPAAAGATTLSPSGFAMNDVRLGARLTAFEPQGWIPGAALAFSAFLPTGDASAFTGTGSARFEPRLVLGADHGRISWSASIGRQLGGVADGLFGSEVTFSAGVAARVDRFQIGPEIFGSAVVDRPAAAKSGVALSERAGAGLEAMLGAKAQLGIFQVGAAGGLGFLRGPGTPEYRFVLGVSIRPFEQKAAPPDTSDRDQGQTNGANGASGSGKGDGKGTSPPIPDTPPPPRDTDGDTVPDGEDACPRLIGDPRAEAPRRGCPPDRDRDGIPDAEDRCPDRAGVVADGDKNGCPPDTDGDGLPDPDDACPREAGARTDDPKTTGCPQSVRVEGTQIVILQQVNFETAKAVILPVSFPLLTQVADVMRTHPEIARVAVDGHTDDRGSEASNLELSRARAVSVMRWLVGKGIDPRRLEARGFGPRRPIDDNKTDQGRARNRRVEFQIRKKTDKGEAGWVDGPID